MLVELISQYGLFLAKVVTILLAIIVLIMFILQSKQRRQPLGSLQITDLNQQYQDIQQQMQNALLAAPEQKLADKQLKKQRKMEAKQRAKQFKQQQKTDKLAETPAKKRLFVLCFQGSSDAHQVNSLREEISAILAVATQQDEVLLQLESPGGVVHGYGLAASQLQRLREQQIPLTVVVDKVAASGGYMMACVAQRIVAAPFAIIGSIGVVAQLPNFHRLLKKNDIDIELHTAGQYKRTLTMLGENSEQGRQKFQTELNDTHQLFKDFVKTMRPSLDIEQVATGEYWFGRVALDKGLIDSIATSDDLIIQAIQERQVIALQYSLRKKWSDRFTLSLSQQIEQLLSRYWQRGQQPLL